MEKTTMKTCAKGTCDVQEQQNVATLRNYKLRCSECNVEIQHSDTVICPKCKKGIPYWSYEPDDGLTDYQRRMIKRFYGNTTDIKVVIQS